jgi:NitT/TauT family transport system ATP-binding protein
MLTVRNLSIAFGGRDLFSPISFDVKSGHITCIMGASGIGKTSILNAISGTIPYNGHIESPEHFTVFQDSHQLFPWFSIRKNLNLVCVDDYTKTVEDWNLTPLLSSTPNKISGGQRQRFTLIRAMYSGKNVLLCDEPLSGLDAVTRYAVLLDFKQKITELNLCCLWITHDLSEAKCIGDDILLIEKNGIMQIPQDINEKTFIEKLVH